MEITLENLYVDLGALRVNEEIMHFCYINIILKWRLIFLLYVFLGAMVAICDISEYRNYIKKFEVHIYYSLRFPNEVD